MDIDVQVTQVFKRELALSEVWRSRYIGLKLMIPYTGEIVGRGSKEYISDKQFLRRRKLKFLYVVCREFSLHIQLGIIVGKQVKHQKQDAKRHHTPIWTWKYKDSGIDHPMARYTCSSNTLEFCRVLYTNLQKKGVV